MPSPQTIAAVYDFEGVFEKAVAALFTAAGITAVTSQQVVGTGTEEGDASLVAQGYTVIDYQKARPRVEVTFTPGAGAGIFLAKTVNSLEQPIETSWSGQLKLDLITDIDIRAHAAFRTQVRFILQSQLRTINGDTLPLHKLQTFYRDGGTSPVMKPEEGEFQTTMLIELDFSIQDEAWATLET